MAAPDDSARLGKAQDRLLELLVEQDEASRLKDWPRVSALEAQIKSARVSHDQLKRPEYS
jgi:hypothetical protein